MSTIWYQRTLYCTAKRSKTPWRKLTRSSAAKGAASVEDPDFDLDDYYKHCEVHDPAALDSLTNGSRRGWLVYALQQLSEAAAMAELKVLYGADDLAY
ncbi:MAG TPA: hypothetical protein VF472_10635 [Burkholderiaceae bacterium]